MKIRHFIVLGLIIAAVSLLLFACSKSKSPSNENLMRIAIIKYATHPALDEVETSFIDTLKTIIASNDKLKDFRFETRDANASPQRAKEFAESVTQPDTALIVTFGTPASQAVARTPSDIPFLYAAVSDPSGAGILSSGRASGISNVDQSIVDEALLVISRLVPTAKKIGTIYNPSEQNSVYVQKMIEKACKKMNFELISRQLSDPTQISSIADNLANDIDVFYSANDNAVNLGIASFSAVAIARKKMLVIGEVSAISKGPAVAVGVDYTETGKLLAKMAEKILLGEPIQNIKPQTPPPPVVRYNLEKLDAIGISVPDDIKQSVNN